MKPIKFIMEKVKKVVEMVTMMVAMMVTMMVKKMVTKMVYQCVNWHPGEQRKKMSGKKRMEWCLFAFAACGGALEC